MTRPHEPAGHARGGGTAYREEVDGRGLRWDELRHFLHAALVRKVPRDNRDTPRVLRRRRLVCALTLVVGAVILGIGLNVPPGEPLFLLLTGLLALVWAAGAALAGRMHLGRAWTRDGRLARPLVQSLALGLLAVGIFCAGAVLVAQVPMLRDPVDAVLDHARYASLPVIVLITLVNGLAEELFFRGALYAAVTRRPVLVTTVLYALVTAASGNLMLVFAAVVLGVLVGAQRRVTGGVLGPMVTHVTWSLSMLLLLPPLLTAVG
ncbi:CPBP family intramembrane glutamic endopeptidase [Ornithinimicrobium sufpigmenti]|uniref:CPBP family intramembrane glutamic endopeptidase n=1 Tax=Ornithinimicrobium sufpigmenti TaxID=2508882 RepID=UPI00307C0F1C